MPEFFPQPLPYLERLQKAKRTIKHAHFRSDLQLAVREVCEAVDEVITALLDREQAQKAESPPTAK